MTAATLLPLCRPLYVHGTPNWVDLHTVNIGAARAFYGGLFGWSFQKRFSLSPIPGTVGPEATMYTSYMAGLGQAMAAELVEQPARSGFGALPSRWLPYVSVVELGAALDLVVEAGGVVVDGVGTRGSLASTAIVAGPDGARIGLWEAEDMAGVGVIECPGALAWLQLETNDLGAACEFYHKIFGWTYAIDDAHGQFAVFSSRFGRVAGMVRSPLEQIESSWSPAFQVCDLVRAIERSRYLGAAVMAEPVATPAGHQGVILDPTGATVTLLEPRA